MSVGLRVYSWLRTFLSATGLLPAARRARDRARGMRSRLNAATFGWWHLPKGQADIRELGADCRMPAPLSVEYAEVGERLAARMLTKAAEQEKSGARWRPLGWLSRMPEKLRARLRLLLAESCRMSRQRILGSGR